MAATFGYLLELTPWITLATGGILGSLWALMREKPLLAALLSNWKNHWVIVGPVVAILVYAMLEISIQTITSSVIKANGLQSGKELPTIFAWLLQLRSAGGELHPALLGAGGGLIVGIGEELFWRGYVQTRLMIFTSHGIAALATAILYSVFYFLALGPLASMLALFLGIVLSMFTLRSKSLLPAVACHTTFLLFVLWFRPDISAVF